MEKGYVAKNPTVYSPCVYNPRSGTTKDVCESLTRTPQRNRDGCCASNCGSPWRLCLACLTQTKTPQPVPDENRLSGLCEFHATHGYKAVIQPTPDTHLVFGRLNALGELDVRDDVSHIPTVKIREADVALVPLPEEERPRFDPPQKRIPRPRAPRKLYRKRPKGLVLVRTEANSAMTEYVPIPRVAEMCLALAAEGKSIRQVAARLHISYPYASYFLRLGPLLPEVLALTTPNAEYKKRLDVMSAAHLAKLRPELQLETAIQVVQGKMSVKALQRFASRAENTVSSKS